MLSYPNEEYCFRFLYGFWNPTLKRNSTEEGVTAKIILAKWKTEAIISYRQPLNEGTFVNSPDNLYKNDVWETDSTRKPSPFLQVFDYIELISDNMAEIQTSDK